jgi:hypothetical protein
MINKISIVVTAVLILGSASVASAAVRHHGYVTRSQLMLLENGRARAAAAYTNAAVHFQNNWNVSY